MGWRGWECKNKGERQRHWIPPLIWTGHLLDCGMILMVYLHPNHAPPVNGAWKAEGAGRKDASGVQP